MMVSKNVPSCSVRRPFSHQPVPQWNTPDIYTVQIDRPDHMVRLRCFSTGAPGTRDPRWTRTISGDGVFAGVGWWMCGRRWPLRPWTTEVKRKKNSLIKFEWILYHKIFSNFLRKSQKTNDFSYFEKNCTLTKNFIIVTLYYLYTNQRFQCERLDDL